MKRVVKIELKTEFQQQPDLRGERKKITAAIKQALSGLKEGWLFDGREAKFTVDESTCHTTQSFKAVGKKPNETALLTAVLREVGKIGWVPNKSQDAVKKLVDKPADDDEDKDIRPPSLVEKTAAAAAAAAAKAAPQETFIEDDIDAAVETAPKVEELPPPPPINTEHRDFFAHIYERDTQISIVYSAVMAAVDTKFYSRSHVVLLGDPGCGKTEIMRSFMNMLGSEHVQLFDGPSTTKAGVEQFILQAQRIPSFVFIEEIEKMPESVSQVLLGLLDARSEIRKTNAKAGHVQREAKVLCVATVNNRARFKTMNQGALFSRFAHEVYCPRPDRDLLCRIVKREVLATNGNTFWVDPAVAYCTQIENNYDPRRSISVCLSGRDGLLDGTYQQMLLQNLTLKDPTKTDLQRLLTQVREHNRGASDQTTK